MDLYALFQRVFALLDQSLSLETKCTNLLVVQQYIQELEVLHLDLHRQRSFFSHCFLDFGENYVVIAPMWQGAGRGERGNPGEDQRKKTR